jgi:hypothetical protein
MSRVYSSLISNELYNTTLDSALRLVAPPRCSASKPELYDHRQKRCVAVSPAEVTANGLTASNCGGMPFQVQSNGQCYSTNSCYVSPNETQICLNGQAVHVRDLPIRGPGVLQGLEPY